MTQLTIEQRFALQRARYECSRMSRHALEKTAVRLLRSRMEQKNGVQAALMQNGIVFKIDEQQDGLPEIISEETFIDLIKNQGEDEIPNDINDVGYEDEDLEDDDLMLM